MRYNYNKLRGRIVEKFGTNENFAKALGISRVAMSNKLTQKTGFSQKEIEKWCCLLEIERQYINDYFFTLNVE